MNTEQVVELREQLIERCPDFTDIQVEHLGNFRVKVHAVACDRHTSLVVVCLSEEHTPTRWAVRIANQLHSVLVAS